MKNTIAYHLFPGAKTISGDFFEGSTRLPVLQAETEAARHM
jgi:hypothetical protein